MFNLSWQNQPFTPLENRIVRVWPSEEDINTFTPEAFRRRLTERITQLLPEDFVGPSREVGKLEITWENELLHITLYARNDDDSQALNVVTKYWKAQKLIDDFSRRLFNALAEEYMLTVRNKHREDVPYIPEP